MDLMIKAALRTLIFLCLLAGACTTPTASVDSDESQLGFLWEARRGEQVLTLLGTMHIGITMQDIPPVLWQRFESADKVIIETDIRQMNADLARRYLVLGPPHDLEKLLPPKTWKKLSLIFKEAYPEMTASELRAQSPAMAASQLMMAAAEAVEREKGSKKPKVENEPTLSMDQLIFDRAQSEGKDVAILESLAEQLDLLEQVFTPEQLADLIDSFEDEKAQYAELEKAYSQGRSQVIAALLADLPKPMRELLLDGRNLRWSQSFDRLFSPKHTFLAVGAAHFGGEQSLLKLLRAQGFSIQALRVPSALEI